MATQAEIQEFISQVVPYNYTTTQLRTLLSSLFDFENLVWFSDVDEETPSVNDDAQAGYKVGSLGFNYENTKWFLCSDVTDGAAVWQQIYPVNSVIQDVFTGLVAQGTSMATTAILSYGVNVFDTSTPTNYGAKLPQPKTGKSTTIVNMSSIPISLFPSNTGGQINNYPLDSPAVIPPDGKQYVFTCIENPLPGAWVWSPPATNQYDSGDISATTTGSSNFYNIAAASSVSGLSLAAERSGMISISGVQDALNRAFVFEPAVAQAYPNVNYLPLFKPTSYWNGMTKIKVYTNVVTNVGTNPSFALTSSAGYNTYEAGTQIFVSQGIGNADTPYVTNFALTNTIAGSNSVGVTANIGDPGTRWGEITLTPSSFLGVLNAISFVGDKFISTDGIEDIWFTRYLTAFLVPRTIGAVKFRFFIEYF